MNENIGCNHVYNEKMKLPKCLQYFLSKLCYSHRVKYYALLKTKTRFESPWDTCLSVKKVRYRTRSRV